MQIFIIFNSPTKFSALITFTYWHHSAFANNLRFICVKYNINIKYSIKSIFLQSIHSRRLNTLNSVWSFISAFHPAARIRFSESVPYPLFSFVFSPFSHCLSLAWYVLVCVCVCVGSLSRFKCVMARRLRWLGQCWTKGESIFTCLSGPVSRAVN